MANDQAIQAQKLGMQLLTDLGQAAEPPLSDTEYAELVERVLRENAAQMERIVTEYLAQRQELMHKAEQEAIQAKIAAIKQGVAA